MYTVIIININHIHHHRRRHDRNYAYIYTYVYVICLYLCLYMYIYICMYVCMHVGMYVCRYVCMYMYIAEPQRTVVVFIQVLAWTPWLIFSPSSHLSGFQGWGHPRAWGYLFIILILIGIVGTLYSYSSWSVLLFIFCFLLLLYTWLVVWALGVLFKV